MASRTTNTIRNSAAGFLGYFLPVLFSFVARTFFVNSLGVSNLGYDTLFSNILSVLSITDLGMTTALTYAMYVPLHDNDYPKMAAIITYFKRIFIAIGILLIMVSALLTPFVDFFVNVPYDVDLVSVRTIFMLYAINSFSTYFFVDMRILLEADQKGYIVSTITGISKILVKIFQIIVLYLYQSYVLYLLVEILFTILSNVYIQMRVKRIYALEKYKNQYIWSTGEKRHFFSNVFYVSLNKIAGISINSTDSLLISKIVGTTVLGLYSNYLLIIGTIYALMDKLLLGCTASLGNLFAEADEQKERDTLGYLQYITSMLSSFMFVFLSLFVHKAIRLWFGNKMLLSFGPIFVVCLNQYFFMNRKFLDIVVQTKGVFKSIMPIKMLEAATNLIISIILGMMFGMTGIFLGSTISLLISYLLEVYVLLEKTFDMRYQEYVMRQLKYLIESLFVYFLLYEILKLVSGNYFSGMLDIFVQVLTSGTIFLGIYYIIYRNDKNFKRLKQTFISLIYKKGLRRKDDECL